MCSFSSLSFRFSQMNEIFNFFHPFPPIKKDLWTVNSGNDETKWVIQSDFTSLWLTGDKNRWKIWTANSDGNSFRTINSMNKCWNAPLTWIFFHKLLRCLKFFFLVFFSSGMECRNGENSQKNLGKLYFSFSPSARVILITWESFHQQIIHGIGEAASENPF